MQTELIKELNKVLKAFPQFWNGDKLHRSMVSEAISKKQPDLIKALVTNEKIKSVYGTDVDGVLIFDFDKLRSLLKYKEYWNNSFTKYRNKVGLSSEGKYLDYSSDVVLDFPFKDCFLEGGMTKEDCGKNEIYYNENIAADEIDRLFSPKALVKTARYDKNGKSSKITKISVDDNLIIKGNNLIALNLLKLTHKEKVKLIYIDPPYNTGSDGFKYNDKFNHSTWLTFIKNRLESAKELLSDDAFICCHIDDSESHYLKVLMDMVFGADNYINTFYIQVRYANKTLKQDMSFHKQIEQVHIYRKSNKAEPNLNETEKGFEKYTHYIEELKDGKEMVLGGKKTIIFDESSYRVLKKEPSEIGLKEIWATGSILDGNSSGRFFRDFLSDRKKTDGLGVLYKVYGIGDDGFDYRYFTGPKKESATKGKYYQGVPTAQLNNKNAQNTTPIENFYDLASYFGNCRHEGGVELRSGKKPEFLLKTIINHFSNQNDLILDFHLGSATTCAVAHKMGRRYIGIEQMDYIKDICIPRMVNVINGDKTGISKDVGWQGGGGFIYTELMELNAYFVHEIQKAQSTEELEKLFAVMKIEAHLNYQVALENVLCAEYEVDGIFRKVAFSELELHEQKQLLIEILDKNQLYVNASDMDDSDLNISESDKAFTRSFYGME
ncbi:DNA methyltransferase [Erwinia tasmaniensis]|uniref:site-specific DNA-methyltransferase (adenine-specific) n=1 Tax=Erwinia tasmaniensis (strain DSM 17950 / CFBP 7177 / CIP 109463 / NCPPB 4357 / Et1/99) TaxID=465817 RepID=B2VAP8_ERWT9|nr:site-specific DNA-methyltransferase [Erwinia tasmaniensis]CAO94796.1 DNA recognition and methylase subunit Mod (type III restriction and modification system), similar to LlaFI [Erwinia tasmaniensis Et1/99]